jgi:hypothetical protein
LILLAALACSGCTLIEHGSHVLLIDPMHFSPRQSLLLTKIKNHHEAERICSEVLCELPDDSTTPDFQAGFRAGYADFLTYGGDGRPPLLPPRKYWRVRGRSPEGRRAEQDWFAGFAAGAAHAEMSERREFATVSSTAGCSCAGGSLPPADYSPEAGSLEELPRPETETERALEPVPAPELLPGNIRGATFRQPMQPGNAPHELPEALAILYSTDATPPPGCAAVSWTTTGRDAFGTPIPIAVDPADTQLRRLPPPGALVREPIDALSAERGRTSHDAYARPVSPVESAP